MTNNSKNITAYLSLGSNIGERIDYLAAAEEKLNMHAEIEIVNQSKILTSILSTIAIITASTGLS